MIIQRNPAGRYRGTNDNSLVLSKHVAGQARVTYRTLREGGASKFAAHTSVYDLLFYASLSCERVDFVAGK